MEHKYTVLIVDDAEHNIEYMSEMLKDSYNIITAQGGSEALRILRGENRPDAVLLDMLMPKPDGYDVLEAMNGDDDLCTIPVMVVTADDDPEAQARSYKLGAVDFVSRGEDIETIRYRVRSILRICELDKMRRENERLRREISSEIRLSALMDNLPGGVAIIKINGDNAECTYFNSELPKLFKMSADEFVMQFVILPHTDWIKTLIKKAGEGDDFSFEFAVGSQSAPNDCQWIRVTAGGITESDGSHGIYCVFLDINAEKRQELRARENGRRLRDNQSMLETIMNNTPGGVSLFERVGGMFRAVFVNPGMANMLGYGDLNACLAAISNDPCLGVSDNDVNAIRQKIADIPEYGGHFSYAFAYSDPNGRKRWLSMRCQLLRSETDGKVKMYAFVTDATKEKHFEDELRATAFFDPLTGLFNRHAFMRGARAAIDENPLTDYAVMSLNIGSFKVVNDLMGRDVGDKVLIVIADAIRELFTGNGVFARFFADKFTVLTPYSERAVHPQMFLDAVQRKLKESGLIPHEIQFYIGVYKITDRNMSVGNMADRSAIACRSISGSFREHIAYYDEKMRQRMLEEQQICDESHRALDNGEFVVYYQPIYGIKARRFTSAEALVRWNHPTKGMISPGKFVPVFEKNGFIAELDLYVLEQVCIFMKRRRDAGLPDFPFSVNISRTSLYNPRLFEAINDLTERYKINPKYFRIEVTESAYNDNPALLLETIDKLRGKCYPVLMDDFGSGYSSLNTLKDIPIDILKLDMKFMQGFEKNGRVGTIVTAVARMAKWLNIPMLAEGVETKEQFDFLSSVGCAYIQGFYFSRPVAEEEFSRLIELEVVNGDTAVIENYSLGEEINELLGSNALVSKLISGAFGGFGIYEMSEDRLEVIRVNEGYMQIMGYTPEDFNEDFTNIWDMMPPEDAEASRRACLETLQTDKAVHRAIRRYNKNGKLLYLDGVHRRLGGTYENPIICIAFNDMTDQVMSKRRVDSSSKEIDEILKATGAAVIDIDFENGTIFHSGDMSEYGVESDTMKKMMTDRSALKRMIHPDDIEKAEHLYGAEKPGKFSEELRLLNKTDDKYYWWKLTLVRTIDDQKKTNRLIGVANFIDPEKRAKITLEDEREHMDAVMSKLDVGILMVEVNDDHKAHVIFSNKCFWNTLELKPVSDKDFFGGIYAGLSQRELQDINDEVKMGGSMRSRYRITRSNGENSVIELTVGLSRAERNLRVYMIMVCDITQQYNDRLKTEAIVRNFHDGLALIRKKADNIEINYSNEKFYGVPGIEPQNTDAVDALLQNAVNSGLKTSDVHIKRGNSDRIIRVDIDEVGKESVDTTDYIVAISDVTTARAKSKNRIAERNANAKAGLYDEVVEIDYRAETAKLTFFRRDMKRTENAKATPLSYIIDNWGKTYVHPDDLDTFKRFVLAPADDPDFTDSYCEIDVRDGNGDNEYHHLGLTLVRSYGDHGDVCVLFIRDNERYDDSTNISRAANMHRMYKQMAEQSHTSVIEIDYVENRVFRSPSLKEYWASTLSDEELSKYEYAKRGLAVHPEDKERFGAFMGELYRSNEPKTIKLRLKMADGSFKQCKVAVSLTKGSDGRVLASLCTISVVD